MAPHLRHADVIMIVIAVVILHANMRGRSQPPVSTHVFYAYFLAPISFDSASQTVSCRLCVCRHYAFCECALDLFIVRGAAGFCFRFLRGLCFGAVFFVCRRCLCAAQFRVRACARARPRRRRRLRRQTVAAPQRGRTGHVSCWANNSITNCKCLTSCMNFAIAHNIKISDRVPETHFPF